MVLKVEKSQFYPLLAKTQNLVEKRTSLDTLMNVFLEIKKKDFHPSVPSSGVLKIFATNLEVGFMGETEVEVNHSFQMAVNAKSLFEIIRELEDGEIEIESDSRHGLFIKQKKSFFHLTGISPDSFPERPSFDHCSFVSLSPRSLKTMIDQTFYCVSTDETRRYLNGLFFERVSEKEGKEKKASLHSVEGGLSLGWEEKKASSSSKSSETDEKDGKDSQEDSQEREPLKPPLYRMVAMNPYRLSFVEKRMEESLLMNIPEGVIIPRRGVLELNSFLDEAFREGRNIDICIEGNLFIIHFKKSFLMIHLINDRYPNYRLLIPQKKEKEKQFSINREIFLSSLKRVALLCHQDSKFISLYVDKGKLELKSGESEWGSAREEVDICYEEESVQLGFNVAYMMEALRSIQSETVLFCFRNSSSPGVIKPMENPSQTCVIMPMSLPQN